MLPGNIRKVTYKKQTADVQQVRRTDCCRRGLSGGCILPAELIRAPGVCRIRGYRIPAAQSENVYRPGMTTGLPILLTELCTVFVDNLLTAHTSGRLSMHIKPECAGRDGKICPHSDKEPAPEWLFLRFMAKDMLTKNRTRPAARQAKDQ